MLYAVLLGLFQVCMVMIEWLTPIQALMSSSYMSRVGPKAAIAYASALDDPTQLGIKEKMLAAGQILDRAGVVKTERVAVESTGGLFILPPKNTDDAEDT